MRKKDLKNRIKILEQQLYLITLHEDEFIEIEGRSALQKRIDTILDEYLEKTKLLKKLGDRENPKS